MKFETYLNRVVTEVSKDSIRPVDVEHVRACKRTGMSVKKTVEAELQRIENLEDQITANALANLNAPFSLRIPMRSHTGVI